VTSDDACGFLPDDFWGLRGGEKGRPYLDGRTVPLSPLPSQAAALRYPGAGEPIWYEVKGTRIFLTPHAGADVTVRADYYKRPAAVSDAASEVPFNGLFDDLIAEYVEIFFRGPSENNSLAAVLGRLVIDGVDLPASRYDRKGPVGFPRGIDWGNQ